jgi:DNA-binding NarL/FixJ family response regulator
MDSAGKREGGTRTILADGEPTVRGALRGLLTQGLGMQVVGEVQTTAALERQVRLKAPDLVIVAWDLIGAEAESAFTELRSSSSSLRIIVVGLRPDTRRAALKAGADAFISMVDAPQEVIRVLRQSQEHDGSNSRGKNSRRAHERDGEMHESGGRS